MCIELKPINMDNLKECIGLEVKEGQKSFVASNMYSLAEAKADGVSVPLAVYANGKMVGFIMFDIAPEDNKAYISRLMIEKGSQRKGYGKAAMAGVLDIIGKEDRVQSIQISFCPENRAAENLYTSLGFEKTGEMDDGEVVMLKKK